MFDAIPFRSVSGTDSRRAIRLLALSTCGFCRRGQEFLEQHGLAYEYAHFDEVLPEVKAAAKEEFKRQFGVALSYPTLLVDGRHSVGYVKRHWEDLLNLPHEELPEADPAD